MTPEFIPKKFCREYIEIKETSHQLVIFMSAVLGIKKAIDDWVPKRKLKAYIDMCKKYGLKTYVDVAFFDVDKKELKKTVGGETLTTTIASGRLLDFAEPNDSIHIFLAKRDRDLVNIRNEGWYPLEIDGRIIQKPYIDLLKFGDTLDYPDCCVKFFRKYNDWKKFSNLYEIFKNTNGKMSYLCNCFAKDICGYIYHMPCSYNCQKTIKYASSFRNKLKKIEPELVDKIDRFLKLPYLIFFEDNMYAFEGKLQKGVLSYSKAYYVARSREKDCYLKDLEKGDSLKISDHKVVIFKSGRKISTIIPPKYNNFKPAPFLVQFN